MSEGKEGKEEETTIVTREQIETFKRDGVVVIPNVLTAEELEDIRRDFDSAIEHRFGFDPTSKKTIKETIKNLTDKEVAGGIVHIYWSTAQLKVMQHPKVFAAITELYAQSFSAEEPEEDFKHVFGDFDPKRAYLYADRACYRLPDRVYEMCTKKTKVRFGTGAHVDCNPWEYMEDGNMSKKKWRPIQGFLALTPNLAPKNGGFMAVKGFHRRFTSYFKNIPQYTMGEFVRITKEHSSDVLNEFEDILYDEGSLVFWDNRVPHMSSPEHNGDVPRKVIYANYLPDVPKNRSFMKEQKEAYLSNSIPPDFRKGAKKVSECTLRTEEFELSELGEKIIGIKKW
jgi:hypothetical protein